jgi:hypothetical protein
MDRSINAARVGGADGVRSLPMTRASQLDAIRARLAGLSAWAKPMIGFDARGNATLRWHEEMCTMDQALALMVYIVGHERVAAAFVADLPEASEEAISPQEREREISKLSHTLLALERQEEVIISCAFADGTEILRRPDANPLAVLRVHIVTASPQPQEAAASAAA